MLTHVGRTQFVASQMKPEQAFSLIARCNQLIVVGDRNQLPPTNFFQKRDFIEEEDQEIEIEDNESVLELADKVIAKNLLAEQKKLDAEKSDD